MDECINLDGKIFNLDIYMYLIDYQTPNFIGMYFLNISLHIVKVLPLLEMAIFVMLLDIGRSPILRIS
jgi:hypothetical protein